MPSNLANDLIYIGNGRPRTLTDVLRSRIASARTPKEMRAALSAMTWAAELEDREDKAPPEQRAEEEW